MPDGKVPLTDPDRIIFAATPKAVRRVLVHLQSTWRDAGIDRKTRETAELVLAEVLNNIVEHACAGCTHHSIELAVTCRAGALTFEVCDNGQAMPGAELPPGDLARLGHDPRELPEGGFGWFLIRNLTDKLRYRREDGWNRLGFQVSPASANNISSPN